MKKSFLILILLAFAFQGVAQEQIIPQQISGEIQLYVNLFSQKRQSQTNAMLQRSYVYFPVIEKSLEWYQIPQWLEYLPMVESTLNTSAKSRSGRMGLWLLTPSMASRYGLVVDDEINECFDPILATDVACDRLQELHDYYGDWLLVVAAYNTSQATVDRAIARADGARDYFAIHQYLPRETRGFVPALLAINYVMSHPEEYGLKPMCGVDLWSDLETVSVTDSISFSRISATVGIPMEELCLFNPKYINKWIPVSTGVSYTLRLPQKYVATFKKCIEQ